MGGGGFIQHMVNSMRDNRASLTSKTKRGQSKSNASSEHKTSLKFPTSDPERLKRIQKKARRRKSNQWVIIYSFAVIFIAGILWFTFFA